jgi:hypothetical protein
MSYTAQLENDRLRAQVRAMEARVAELHRPQSDAERDALAAAQSRADSVARMFGTTASAPVPGETSIAYRKRLLAPLMRHTRFKGASLERVDASALAPIEEIAYQDAVVTAKGPEAHAPGSLIPIVTRENGRDVTRFTGDIMSWMAPFMLPGQVGRILRDPSGDRS